MDWFDRKIVEYVVMWTPLRLGPGPLANRCVRVDADECHQRACTCHQTQLGTRATPDVGDHVTARGGDLREQRWPPSSS
jgi:hypothetical protein